MALRNLIFLTVILLVLGAGCAYMAERSLALSPVLARHPALVRWTLGVMAGLLFAVPVLHRVPPLARWTGWMYWLSYGGFSFLSTYLPYLAAADLAQYLLGRFAGVRAGGWACALAAGAALVSVLLGVAAALRPVATRRVQVPMADLPAGLEGFRIVQISDLHLGPLVRRSQVEHILAATRALRPDLIAVTGDLVDGTADGVGDQVERLGALEATHGVCFVTGNHEYYSGVAHWLKVIKGMGWKVLDNEHVLLEHRGARLAVAGMPDPTARRGPDLARALAGIPADAFPILLFHPPIGAAAAARAGVRLQLSGHTHAGQYFPWSLLVPALFEHPRGLGRSAGMWIYTSVGTGFWGPPNRFLVPPELTLIVLAGGGA